jgi:hypothetical protein
MSATAINIPAPMRQGYRNRPASIAARFADEFIGREAGAIQADEFRDCLTQNSARGVRHSCRPFAKIRS